MPRGRSRRMSWSVVLDVLLWLQMQINCAYMMSVLLTSATRNARKTMRESVCDYTAPSVCSFQVMLACRREKVCAFECA